ncbi:hypothetical protein pb186bvf_021081 [Paramecium bursaria]
MQSYQKFLQFNFTNNQSWKEYVSEIDPSVPKERIEKLKKVWYKDNIDPNFDLDYQPGPHQHQYAAPNNNSQTSTSYQQLSLVKRALYDSENILKLAFIISALLHTQFTTVIALSVCLLAIYRQLQRPKWDKQYAQKLILNEFAQNLVYLGVFLFLNSYRILINIPLIVHFWIGIAEYLNQRQGFIYTTFKKYVDATREKKDYLMNIKYLLEIGILPIQLVLCFFSSASLFQIFYYGNYLRIKYVLNAKSQVQFRYFNSLYIEPLRRFPGLRQIVDLFYKLCAYLTKIG